ncbi:MAG: sulfatase [Opitutales bacterium]|nr:sulfatase [Opitutales bacterium]
MKFFKLILAAAILIANPLTGAQAEQRPPNIVFFLVDDLGWSDVGCNGSTFYDTPNIDQLAAEGVRFTDGYAACHVCSPTRASILTGKYPATLNLTDWLNGRGNRPYQVLLNPEKALSLDPEETTLAEVLKEAGYATALFGKWHLGGKTNPTEHGFDVHEPHSVNSNLGKRGFRSPENIPGLDGGEYVTDRLAELAAQYIDENTDKPFLLYMSHFSVHDPIQGRPDLVEKYKKKLVGMPAQAGPDFILEGNPDSPTYPSRAELDALLKLPEYADTYKSYPNDLVKVKQKQDNVQLAGMVESVDQSLGTLMAKLKEHGIEDNTIVIFMSDNGGMSVMNGTPHSNVPKQRLNGVTSSSNLPLRGAKGWLYEGGIRVPLIVKWPHHGKIGTVCDEPVISTDFFPTILEMVGVENKTKDIDGKSFTRLVRGEEMDRGPIYWHFPHYSNHGMQSPGGAIRDGDYKLLEYFENGTVQLFNLVKDIGEQNDLSKIEVQKTKELTEKLHQWRQEVDAQMMSPNPDYDPAKDLWSKPAR